MGAFITTVGKTRDGKTSVASFELNATIDKNGVFSASGWYKVSGGEERGGQCLDDMREAMSALGLRCEKLEAILKYWPRWHLNDMNAGSPRQMEALRAMRARGERTDYDNAVKALARIGLLEDKEYLVDGEPYEYGTRWLFEELPKDVEEGILRAIAMPFEVKKAGDSVKRPDRAAKGVKGRKKAKDSKEVKNGR